MTKSPVLLIHGVTATGRVWDLVRPRLEPDYELLVPTLVGHCGGPAMPDPLGRPLDALVDGLEEALDDAGHEKVHILGNSLGGWLSFELAARGRALSVLALSPGLGWEGETVPPRITSFFKRANRMAPHAARVAHQLAASPRLRHFALRDVVAHPERVPPATAAEMIKSAAKCPMLTALGDAAEAGDVRSPIGGLDVPVRIAWADKDRVLPQSTCSGHFRTILPDAEWVALPDCGHVSMLDDPGLVARHLREVTAYADLASNNGHTPPGRRQTRRREARSHAGR